MLGRIRFISLFPKEGKETHNDRKINYLLTLAVLSQGILFIKPHSITKDLFVGCNTQVCFMYTSDCSQKHCCCHFRTQIIHYCNNEIICGRLLIVTTVLCLKSMLYFLFADCIGAAAKFRVLLSVTVNNWEGS